jgi:hypothetical protein
VDGWWELQCIHERNLLFFAGCIHERNLVFLKKKYSHLAMHAMVINFETLLFSKKTLRRFYSQKKKNFETLLIARLYLEDRKQCIVFLISKLDRCRLVYASWNCR